MSAVHPQYNDDYGYPSRSNTGGLKIPSLLWNGGYVWKIPFKGRGDPEPRIVAIKRERTKGPGSMKVHVVDSDGSTIPSATPQYICVPYTLLIYYLKDASGTAPRQRNVKQLPIVEGTYVVEGHSTPAFWKLANRNGSIPRKERCFSIVTPNRSLDLAVDTDEEANEWRIIFHILDLNVKNGKDIKSILLWKTENPPSIKANKNVAKIQPYITQPSPRNLDLVGIAPRTNHNTSSGTNSGNNNNNNNNSGGSSNHIMSNVSPAGNHSGVIHMSSPLSNYKPISPSAPMDEESIRSQFFYAVHTGQYRIVEQYLSHGLDVNLEEQTTRDTALMIACKQGYPHIVSLCLKYGGKNDPHPEFGGTALHAGVHANQYETTRALLQAAQRVGSDIAIINLCDANGKTPLHLASCHNNPKLVQLLLDHGADINSLDNDCATTLHAAVSHSCYKTLSTLLDQGGDQLLDVPDNRENTPLHLAVEKNDMTCTTVLLETAANIDIRNAKGLTVLDIARHANNKNMVELIMKYATTNNNSNIRNTRLRRSTIHKNHRYNESEPSETATDVCDEFFSPDSFLAMSEHKSNLDMNNNTNSHYDASSNQQYSYNNTSGNTHYPEQSPYNASGYYDNQYYNASQQQQEYVQQSHYQQGQQQIPYTTDPSSYTYNTYDTTTATTSVTASEITEQSTQAPNEEFLLYGYTWQAYMTEGYMYYWCSSLDHSQWEDPRIYNLINPTDECNKLVQAYYLTLAQVDSHSPHTQSQSNIHVHIASTASESKNNDTTTTTTNTTKSTANSYKKDSEHDNSDVFTNLKDESTDHSHIHVHPPAETKNSSTDSHTMNRNDNKYIYNEDKADMKHIPHTDLSKTAATTTTTSTDSNNNVTTMANSGNIKYRTLSKLDQLTFDDLHNLNIHDSDSDDSHDEDQERSVRKVTSPFKKSPVGGRPPSVPKPLSVTKAAENYYAQRSPASYSITDALNDNETKDGTNITLDVRVNHRNSFASPATRRRASTVTEVQKLNSPTVNT